MGRGRENLDALAVRPAHVFAHQRAEPHRSAQQGRIRRQVGVKAADHGQPQAPGREQRGEPDWAWRRQMDDVDAVRPRAGDELEEAREVHAHVPVEGDRHAKRAHREVVGCLDRQRGRRVDAQAEPFGHVPQRRRQRRRDAVDLVEVVVREDRDVHIKPPREQVELHEPSWDAVVLVRCAEHDARRNHTQNLGVS